MDCVCICAWAVGPMLTCLTLAEMSSPQTAGRAQELSQSGLTQHYPKPKAGPWTEEALITPNTYCTWYSPTPQMLEHTEERLCGERFPKLH